MQKRKSRWLSLRYSYLRVRPEVSTSVEKKRRGPSTNRWFSTSRKRKVQGGLGYRKEEKIESRHRTRTRLKPKKTRERFGLHLTKKKRSHRVTLGCHREKEKSVNGPKLRTQPRRRKKGKIVSSPTSPYLREKKKKAQSGPCRLLKKKEKRNCFLRPPRANAQEGAGLARDLSFGKGGGRPSSLWRWEFF